MSIGTVVIGGGQSGLATARELLARGQEVLVLDRGKRLGDTWRSRWDSLELFTPAERDGLPGLRFPGSKGSFPSKDALADYLEHYAKHFQISTRLGVEVTAVEPIASGYRVNTTVGEFEATSVVFATGANAVPRVPDFATRLDPRIRQLHAGEYRRPGDLPDGEVVVVGAGASGAQLSIEIAASHPTVLAGRPTAHIPDGLLRRAGGAYWFLIHRVLTLRTPIGRKAAAGFFRRGGPLIGVSIDDVRAAGVELAPRVVDADGAGLLFEDGRRRTPTTVVWATGYRPDFGWLPDLPLGKSGAPAGVRGAVSGHPGLYTVGMPFQYGLTSGFLGGVGRDAAWVAETIAAQAARPGGRTPTGDEQRPRRHPAGRVSG